MAASQSSSSLPQGFSIFQPALGAQLQFFPAVGTQELDDMINAHIPGPASIQEKRATVAVDFLEYAQLTGQTFKFYPVYSVGALVESPVSDSVSSFNASPATSSWDWSQASVSSSRSSVNNSRHPYRSSPSTVSRHQTADFSHLPGMKIMTKDGKDITNTASRGSKTKEQRDHAHLMRIIKACDSCRRKKIRCDPSHKKRSAASQAQPSQSSKVAKKTKAPSPSRPQQPTASPPVLGDDGFLAQVPIDWDASFTFDDLELPDFTMPYEPFEELANQTNAIPEDYDFFFDPEGYLSPQTSFSSSSSSSASPSKLASPSSQTQSPAYASASSSTAPDISDAQCSLHSMPVPFHDSAGSVDAYADFNLYSPASSFSEDEHMVSIEASSERFSTKSVSQSPAEQVQSQFQSQTQSQSPAGPLELSASELPGDSWYNDGSIDWASALQPSATGSFDLGSPAGVTSTLDSVDVFYDAQWLCAPQAAESPGVPIAQPVAGCGAGNGDLMAAHESAVSSDGVFRKKQRPQTVTHSSTTSYGRSSATTETENHSSTNSCGRYSAVTETESILRDRMQQSVEAGSLIRHAVNTDGHVDHGDVQLSCSSAVRANAVASGVEGSSSVSRQSSPPAVSAVPGSPAGVSSGGSGVVSIDGPSVLSLSYTQKGLVRVGSGSAISVNHQTVAQSSASVLQVQPAVSAEKSSTLDVARERGFSSTSSSLVPVDTAIDASIAVANNTQSAQRIASGIQKPHVGTMAYLSSQAVMLVLVFYLVWSVLQGAPVASVMLSVAALALRTVVCMDKGFFVDHIGSTVDACDSMSSRSRGKSSTALFRCRSSEASRGQNLRSPLTLGRLLSI